MTDPRSARRLALFLSAGLLVALACTCTNPLAGLRGGTGGGIGGLVWFDTNGDGLQDEGESGLEGIEVRLLDESGAQVDSATTGSDGRYQFTGEDASTYVLWFIAPNDLQFTLNGVGSDDSRDSDAAVTSGQTDSFGFDGSNDVTRDAGLVKKDNEPTLAPATVEPTPVVTAEATPETGPQFSVTYHHTVPGQYSEIIILFSSLEPGQEVSGQVTGPAVDGDGTFTAYGAADGTCEVRVKIFQYGVYDVDVPGMGPSQAVNVTADEPPGN